MLIVNHFDIRCLNSLIAENKILSIKCLSMRMPKPDRLFYKCTITLVTHSQTISRVIEKQWNLHAAMLRCIMHEVDVNASVLMLIRLISTSIRRWEN